MKSVRLLLGSLFLIGIGFAAGVALPSLRAWFPVPEGEPYVCPMEEDADVRSDRPGKCPKCGMDLVPLSATGRKDKQPSAASRTTTHEHEGHGTRPAQESVAGDVEYWYCPMHPTYHSDRAGDCPICNMKLVPKRKGEGAERSNVAEHAVVTIQPERQQLIGVRLGVVERKNVERTIRAVGRVDYDERRLATVSLKLGGWVEELLVNATGQVVKKGDPLLVLYSPELYEAQRNLVLAVEGLATLGDHAPTEARGFAQENLKSARERLLLWDLSEDQISEIEKRREAKTRVTLHSKVEGVVIQKNVTQGASVQPGADLYRIVDLGTVWLLADVYEHELPELRPGMDATVTLATTPGQPFLGKVSYLYPYLNEPTRTVRVRIEVPNPEGKLRPGMYGQVSLASSLGERLVVDEQAVVDTGTRRIVFVAQDKGRFEPREVTLGPRADGGYVVQKGLAEGERVVISGNFLVDSESRLKYALISGGEPKQTEHAGHGK